MLGSATFYATQIYSAWGPRSWCRQSLYPAYVLHVDLLHVYATLNGDHTMALNHTSNRKRWPSLQNTSTCLVKKNRKRWPSLQNTSTCLVNRKHMHIVTSSLNFILRRSEWTQDISLSVCLAKGSRTGCIFSIKDMELNHPMKELNHYTFTSSNIENLI